MNKQKWQGKERKDAKLFGSRPTPRSGGMWFAKGDSKSDKYLIENKTTDKESYSVKSAIWLKIQKEALLSDRIPLLSVMFGTKNVELVIMDKNDFLTMQQGK